MFIPIIKVIIEKNIEYYKSHNMIQEAELLQEEIDSIINIQDKLDIIEAPKVILKEYELDSIKQYYWNRDLFCKYFKDYAPSFYDYMWDQGSRFSLDSFEMFRDEDEFYLLHKDTGIMINWYKHLGRTNTCNITINLEIFKELLMLLQYEITSKIKK